MTDPITPVVPTEDIVALHKEGLSPSEIAARLGTTYDIVYRRLVRAGYEPHVAPPKPVSTEDIIALHEEGLSPREIAIKLDTSSYTVHQRLVRAGYKPHVPPPPVPTEDIIALHEEGLPPSEIAGRLNTTYKAVETRLRRAGLTPHPEPKVALPPPVVKQEDIVALHKEGLSPPEIAARLGVSPQFIRGRLTRAGFKPNPHPVWGEAKERTREIVSLHNEGYTPKQIAKKLGCSWDLVHKRLREARLVPHPSAAEAENTLRGLDEIVSLAKEGIPRQEIAKRIGSTWPLVAEVLEESSVRPVWPACEELGAWASSLLPILDEIRKAHPDTEPIVRKVEQLEKELVAIKDATWTVEDRLPYKEKKADKERWCIAPISQAASTGLDRMDALKGCVKLLDVAKLPKKLEQAETCISGITNVIEGAVCQIPRLSASPTMHHSPIIEDIKEIDQSLKSRAEEIKPEELAEIDRLVSDIRLFLSGLMLPWERITEKERAERELWEGRIQRGKTELVNRIEGKYATYETYRFLPTEETWVRTTAKPYT